MTSNHYRSPSEKAVGNMLVFLQTIRRVQQKLL